MIDGIGSVGKVDACAQAVRQLFSPSSRRAETEKKCVKVRERVRMKERERSTRKQREGRRRAKRKSKSTFLLPFRQNRCLQLHAESYRRTWHGCSPTGSPHRSLQPQGETQYTHTQRVHSVQQNMVKMTAPQATQLMERKERQKPKEREREKPT